MQASCARCSQLLPTSAAFCRRCGLARAPRRTRVRPVRPGTGRKCAIGACAALLGVGAASVAWLGWSSATPTAMPDAPRVSFQPVSPVPQATDRIAVPQGYPPSRSYQPGYTADYPPNAAQRPAVNRSR